MNKEELVNFLSSKCNVKKDVLIYDDENEIIFNFMKKVDNFISLQCGSEDIYNEPIITSTINERINDFHIEYTLTEETCKERYDSWDIPCEISYSLGVYKFRSVYYENRHSDDICYLIDGEIKCKDDMREDCNPEDYPQEIVKDNKRLISFCTDYHKKYIFEEDVHFYNCLKYQQQNSLDKQLITLLNSMDPDRVISLSTTICHLYFCTFTPLFIDILEYYKDIEEVLNYYNKIMVLLSCPGSLASLEAELEYDKKVYSESNNDDYIKELIGTSNNMNNSDNNINNNANDVINNEINNNNSNNNIIYINNENSSNNNDINTNNNSINDSDNNYINTNNNNYINNNNNNNNNK